MRVWAEPSLQGNILQIKRSAGRQCFNPPTLDHSRELVGGLGEDWEGSEVHGHDDVEVQQFVAGQRGGFGVHGVVAANGDQADVGLMQALDQGHVGEYVGVAGVVDRPLPAPDDEARAHAHIDAFAVLHVPGAVNGVDHGEGEAVGLHGAADVHADAVGEALIAEPRGDLVNAGDLRAMFLPNVQRITDVIAMPVGDQDVIDLADDLSHIFRTGRISREEGIDKNRFSLGDDTKGGMPEPLDFHDFQLPAAVDPRPLF